MKYRPRRKGATPAADLLATAVAIAFALPACRNDPAPVAAVDYPVTVRLDTARGFGFEHLDSAFAELVDTAAGIEVLAEGFDWAEGPVYVPQLDAVLFSDVAANVVYARGLAPGQTQADTFLYPSGYFADPTASGEPGSNGLLLDAGGMLLLAQHGERRVARLDRDLADVAQRGHRSVGASDYTALAEGYGGERLNSPNDLTLLDDGDLLFTDPPYGVDKTFGEAARELDFSGVYRLGADGALTLLTAELPRPNGIVLTPDRSHFIVANSQADSATWTRCAVPPAGEPATACASFADATARVSPANPGIPDGMVALASGALLATGPGGVLAYGPTGRLYGVIRTGRATANVTVGGADGRDAFVTADDLLLRVRLRPSAVASSPAE